MNIFYCFLDAYLREASDNGCGKPLLPSECQYYSTYADGVSAFATQNNSGWPRGCLKYSTTVYYNMHETGTGHGSMQQVCFKGK